MIWPSDLTRRALLWLLPAEEQDMIVGDLEEEYRGRVLPALGRLQGEVWHASEALSLFMHFGRDGYGEYRPARRTTNDRLAQSRSQRGDKRMAWLRDVTHAVKALGREPVTAFVVVATLALGIGANTAMFSVVDAALLSALPYPEQDRLVQISNRWPGQDSEAPLSPLDVRDVESRPDLIEIAGAYANGTLHLTRDNGEARRLEVARASTGFFRLLGYQPLLGRTFNPEDEVWGRHRSAILSHRLWVSEFGADSALVGRAIRLDGDEFRVAGVAPSGFRMPHEADLWTPLAFDPQMNWFSSERRGWQYLYTFGRLAQGVSTAAAGTGLSAQMAESAPQRVSEHGQYLTTVFLREHLLGDTRSVLALLMGAVGFVLLIASANLMNLLLVRAESRSREFAVRRALGSGSGSLARLVFVETLLLAALGGVAGLVLAQGILGALARAEVEALASIGAISLNAGVLAFTATVTLVTALLFGLGPALKAARSNPQVMLRESSARTGTSRAAGRFRAGLVAAEVALSLVLLVGVGSSLRSFQHLVTTDPGFHPEGVLSATFELPAAGFDASAGAELYRSMVSRVAALPGVESAALTNYLPLAGRRWTASIDLIDPHPSLEGVDVGGNMRAISSDYFRTMGIELLGGRDFTMEDRGDGPPVAIVDETLASEAWPESSPVGKRIMLGALSNSEPTTIVGVVGSVKDAGLGEPANGYVYFPTLQRAERAMTLVARVSAGDPSTLASSVLATIRELEPKAPVYQVRTMTDQVSKSVAGPRLTLMILAGFGIVAVLLAAIGVYGVLSYTVSRRTNEIGTRIALGARPSGVVMMIVTQVMRMWLLGSVLGLVVAVAVSRAVRSLLFEVDPADPLVLVLTALFLGLVSLAAALLPARRAATLDCVQALRAE